MSLSSKQMRFVKAFLECGDPAGAAQRAGYKGKDPKRTAWAILRREDVQKAIAEAKAAGPDLSFERLVRDAENTLMTALQKDQGSVALKAVETLARLGGMWNDKKQQKILEIIIVEEFDPNDPGGTIEYDEEPGKQESVFGKSDSSVEELVKKKR